MQASTHKSVKCVAMKRALPVKKEKISASVNMAFMELSPS
jgi:hypothetical protein